MVLGEALRTLTTLRGSVLTGIETLFVVTCLVIRAVCISLAFSYKEIIVGTINNCTKLRLNI